MRTALLCLLACTALRAATVTVTVVNDAGQQVSTSVTTTTDSVLAAFTTQMAVELTRTAERSQGRAASPVLPPSIADVIKAGIVSALRQAVIHMPPDPKLKPLLDQESLAIAARKAYQGSLVK